MADDRRGRRRACCIWAAVGCVALAGLLAAWGYVAWSATAWAHGGWGYDPPGAERRPDTRDPDEFLPTSQQIAESLALPPVERPESGSESRVEWVAAGGRVPSIDVRDGIQGGIHIVDAWLDPGEAGCVWVEVRHAELGHRLSVSKTVARTQCVAPHPPDGDHLLHFVTEAMVDEGNWDYTYPARFEVRFRPAAGGPDRTLIELEREINGWQR